MSAAVATARSICANIAERRQWRPAAIRRDWIRDPGVLDDWNDTRSILDM
jgi:hypothetical protein